MARHSILLFASCEELAFRYFMCSLEKLESISNFEFWVLPVATPKNQFDDCEVIWVDLQGTSRKRRTM
jgi:hypothetical protein